MSQVGELDRLQQGVLVFLANRPVHRTEGDYPVSATQGLSGPELVAAVGRMKVERAALGPAAGTDRFPLLFRNPYYTKDATAVHAAVESLREAGLIESRPPVRGNRTLVHVITRAGAEAIGHTALAEAIGEGVTAGVYRDRLAAGGSRGDVPNTVTMSDVAGVLGTVLGRDSEAAKQILELLRDQHTRGR